MINQNSIASEKIFDGRSIPCSVKHGQIIQRWLDLAVGDYFVLINDHDPVRMHDQFSAQWPQAFSWEHLMKGPDEFRVKITRLKATVPVGEVDEGRPGKIISNEEGRGEESNSTQSRQGAEAQRKPCSLSATSS